MWEYSCFEYCLSYNFVQGARSSRTTSSPAAGSEVRRNDERSCRRSGAAPCCAAVGTPQPTLAVRQSTLSRAEKHQPSKPKRRTRSETPRTQKLKAAPEMESGATRNPERRARTRTFQPQKPRCDYSHFARDISATGVLPARFQYSKRSSTTTSSPAACCPQTSQSQKTNRRQAVGCSALLCCVLDCCTCDKRNTRADTLNTRNPDASTPATRNETTATGEPDRNAASRETKPQRQANPTATETPHQKQRSSGDQESRQKPFNARDERTATENQAPTGETQTRAAQHQAHLPQKAA